MAIETVKRLASDLLGVGENKIRIKPVEIKRAEEALTRGDVLALIKEGIVYKMPKSGRRKKEKRSRRHSGSKRGRLTINQKEEWMKKIRAQRKYLRLLVQNDELKKEFKRVIYGKVKSGIFKNKKAFYAYLKENNLLNIKQ